MQRGIFLTISEPGNLHGQGQRWEQHFVSLLISMSEAVLGIRVQLLNLKMALLWNKWNTGILREKWLIINVFSK